MHKKTLSKLNLHLLIFHFPTEDLPICQIVVPAYNYGQTFLALIFFVMYPLKEKNDSKYWYGGGLGCVVQGQLQHVSDK